MKTNRLYYADCYLREFDARVVRAETDQRGARVELDRTAFYPASGGQPADRGTLGGAEVLDVLDEGEKVVHILSKAPDGESVRGAVEWDRRFDHMQQHTGQHILSAAFEKIGSYRTVSFHLGSDSSTIDLDSDRVGLREAEEAETLANQVVFEDREVRILFKDSSQLDSLALRKPTEREGEVRLIEVEGFDLSACGGTHVRRTGAVGLIALRKLERMKSLARVEFVCGMRALRTVRRDFNALTEIARLYSASLEKVPELAARQFEEARTAARAREKMATRLAEFKAYELRRAAQERGGVRCILHVVTREDLIEAKALAHAAALEPATVALIGEPATMDRRSGLFFAQSKQGPHDMAALLKATIAKFGGKGGGTRDFAQGGGLDNGALAEALNFAASLLG